MSSETHPDGTVFDTGVARVLDVAGHRTLPRGTDNFMYAASQCVYVDKSLLVRDIVDQGFAPTLFCRPRRFGKSLAMGMLRAFFEAPVPGEDPAEGAARRALFERMLIWDEGERYRAEQGRYPVVAIKLGDVKYDSWDATLAGIAGVVADEYRRHAYVLDSDVLEPADRAAFEAVRAYQPGDEANYVLTSTSLKLLTRLLRDFHGAPCVVLIDEYDTPFNAGWGADERFYRDVVTFMRIWLTGCLKSNDALGYACLTGVQRVSKESIFSGLNNLTLSTPLDPHFSEAFGFAQADVGALADLLGCQDRLPEMERWYDGYNFGGARVYNPFSVVRYLANGCRASSYWNNSSDNAIIRGLLEADDPDRPADLLALMQDGGVERPLDLNLVYTDLEEDPEAVWSQLYLSGYVTTDDVDGDPDDDVRERLLRIPNGEVARVYRREVYERFCRVASRPSLARAARKALLAGDEGALGEALGAIVRDCVSFYDLRGENSAHMLLLGMVMEMPGYQPPRSNREAGDGRFDIMLEPLPENVGRLPEVVVELKWLRPQDGDEEVDRGQLDGLARQAVAQIGARRYDASRGPAGSLRWGVALAGKHVAVACERA